MTEQAPAPPNGMILLLQALGNDQPLPETGFCGREVALEICKLLVIWEAASDFQMAERNDGFADFIGSLDRARRRLANAIADYEDGR